MIYKKIDGLDQSEVMDGFVVYDTRTDRAHFLNATGAIIFELCDGTLSGAKIAQFLQISFSLEEPPTVPVEDCLLKLLSEGLIEKCGQ